jgi:hypothetical protein
MPTPFSSSSTDASQTCAPSTLTAFKSSRTTPRNTSPTTTPSQTESPRMQNTSEISPSPHKANTTIIAEIDVGWGNSVSIRGEGGPLTWDKGVQMTYQEPHSWIWKTNTPTPLTFKFLINDQQWSQGENQTVAAGSTYIGKPNF